MDLFRKSALQNRLSPEQLDQLITITKPRDWIALLGVIIILIVIIVWSIIGKVSISVPGEGILIRPGGYRIIQSPFEGMITKVIHPKSGDQIQQGQVVAEISHPVLENRINIEEKYLQQLNQEMKEAQKKQSNNIDALQQTIEERKHLLATLKSELDVTTKIISPLSGTFLALRSDVGTYLKQGDSVLSTEDIGGLTALVFIPPDTRDVDLIKAGMAVKIFPGIVKDFENGYLIGKVRDVSKFPLSPQVMMNLINNEYLAKFFSRSGPPYLVEVDLIPDAATKSGYKWSLSAGKDVHIESGTLFTSLVEIASLPPIELVLPIVKKGEKK